MPSIPSFDSSQAYGFTPVPTDNPSADSGAAAALASGASQVSQASDALGARAQELIEDQKAKQRRSDQLTQAVSTDSQTAVALSKLQDQFSKDPDFQTAPDRFTAAATALKQQTLAGITDPQVAAMVGRNFDQRASTSTVGVYHSSFLNGNASNLAAAYANGDNYTKLMGSAADPGTFKQNLDNMAGAYAGAAAAGLINPEQQRVLTSQALRNALTIKAASDPASAKMLFDQNTALLTGQDFGALSEHLQPLLDRAYDNSTVVGIVRSNGAPGAGGAGNAPNAIPVGQRQSLVQQAVAGTPIPPALLAAQVQQESRWDPGATGSVGEIGLGQIKPSTAQRPGYGVQGVDPGTLRDPLTNLRFTAQYLYGRGKSAGLQDGDWQDPAKVAAALKAYNGGGDPNYAQNVMGRMATGPTTNADAPATLSNGDPAPDLDAQLKQADAATAGLPLYRRMYVFNRIRQNASEWQASHAVELAGLNRTVANLSLAYQQGQTQQDPPEAQIRQLLPKEADGLIDQLRLNRIGGDAIKAIRFASPEDTMLLMQQWAPPNSVPSGKAHLVGNDLAGPGTLPTPLDTAGGSDMSETPDHFRIRQHVLAALAQADQQKQAALRDDPADYVASAPELAPFAKSPGGADPATNPAFGDASMALQRRLGVASPRLLTNSQVQSVAAPLSSTDPATGDMGAALDGLAQHFGANWPQAFGELVQVGHISPAYQVLASMDTPGQAPARQDLQRVFRVAAQKGGLEALKKDAPPDQVKAIDSGLDDTMAPFRDTTIYNQGGVNLLSTMRNAVQHLATYYAMQGQQSGPALRNAYNGIIGQKYDTGGPDGAMLVPKGMLTRVWTTAEETQASLAAADLAPIPDQTGVRTDLEQREMARQVARGGIWVPNKDASGLQLIGKYGNGITLPVRRADGTPVQLLFDHLPPPTPPSFMPSSPIDVQ